MHNKSFSADGQATIVGGRNVGAEYLGLGEGMQFADLDVLAVGSAAAAATQEFERYWNSASAYPAAWFVGPSDAEGRAALLAAFAEARADPQAAAYLAAVAKTPLLRELFAGRLALEWVPTRLLSDDPAKTLAARGVQVRVLTDSLAASDVVAVHASYAKRRKALLRAGSGSGATAGLHAKTIVVDRERIFVGSFNFDPRSALLNTEMGLVIYSPAMATALAEGFESVVPWVAYEVRLAADGERLQWIERKASAEPTVHGSEPQTSAWRRLGVGLLSWLPIDWLL